MKIHIKEDTYLQMTKNFKIVKIKNIRDGVFETNSSSNHTLVIREDYSQRDLQAELTSYLNMFSADVPESSYNLSVSEFYIPVFLDSEFGQSEEVIANAFEKLSYVLSAIELSTLEEQFNIRETIKKFIPNFKGFRFITSHEARDKEELGKYISIALTRNEIGMVDHQSLDLLPYLLATGYETLDEIIFDSRYTFIIGGDYYLFDEMYPELEHFKRYEAARMPYLRESYYNGNYYVQLYSDGSKIRYIEDEQELSPEFPECIDLKVSNYCPYGCAFCHERSTKLGQLGFSDKLIDFITTLKPGTEVAIGGGAITEISYEQFKDLTNALRRADVVINITINWREIDKYEALLEKYRDEHKYYFYASSIGVSVTGAPKSEYEKIKSFSRSHVSVLHVINGLDNPEDLKELSTEYSKLLILGYKNFGRGVDYLADSMPTIVSNQKKLKESLPELKQHFTHISFDNLAVEQLNMREEISDTEWKLFYLGGDGETTMYIDGTNMTYGVNSTAKERFEIKPGEGICEIFKKVRENNDRK